MIYNIDFDEKAKLKLHVRKFFLYPQYWNDAKNQISLNLLWSGIKFESQNINQIPKKSGIYCFVVKPNYINFVDTAYCFYVGKTNRTLAERYKEYLNEQLGKGKPRDKVFEMLTLYRDCIFFYFAVITNNIDVDNCEMKILNTLMPHINTSIPKAKLKPEIKHIFE